MNETTGSVFVFGSNLAGRHGLGAALHARQNKGAVYGQGVGRQGDSYAIPTKDADLNVLPLSEIAAYVNSFILYAKLHKDVWFEVTAIGTGLAGYSHKQIKPMFDHAPANCMLPNEWKTQIGELD